MNSFKLGFITGFTFQGRWDWQMLLGSHTEGMGIQFGVLFFGKLFQFIVSHKSESILPLWSELLAWTNSNYSSLFCWLLPVNGVQITPCLLCLRNNYTAGQIMHLFDLGVGDWMFYTIFNTFVFVQQFSARIPHSL